MTIKKKPKKKKIVEHEVYQIEMEVTQNTKEFNRIPKLKVEDWASK